MKKFLLPILGILVVLALGAGQLSQSVQDFGVVILTSNNASATQLVRPPEYRTKHRQICFKNMTADFEDRVYISTFSTVDETLYGWPLVGTEKECHDFGPAVPVYFWSEDTKGPDEIRVMISR